MNRIIEFDIDNNQREYAACLRMIDILENKCSCEQEDYALFEKARYKNVDSKPILSDIVADDFVPCTRRLPVIGEKDICWFLFRVNCADADDIINLIYYCLVNDRIGGKGILCVKCDKKQRSNIKDLLSDLLMSKVIGEYYTFVGDEYERVTLNGARKIKRFSPIFRISSTLKIQENVNYWRQSVQTFLRELYQKIPLIKSGSKYAFDYFLPHIAPGTIKKKCPGDIWPGKVQCREIQLINSCVECFCSSVKIEEEDNVEHRYIKRRLLAERRYAKWNSRELFDMIKHMPLLAMYIFCLSDYYQKDVEKDSWEDIEQEIFDARDMAEGLLQILENIYHSEYRTGYFCFRIHQNDTERSEKYLKKEYREYMENRNGNDKQPLNYLEIRVADFSHRTIVMQFNKTLTERIKKSDEAEKKIYEEISVEAGQLELSSFYDEKTQFWQKYNSLSENVIHHYGIQIFQSLIECYHGCFRVRSGSTYMPDPDKDFYSTLRETPERAYAIPGTQYDALIPFGKQDMIQSISMDVNLRYDNHLIVEYEACPNKIRFNAETIKTVLAEAREDLSYQDKKEFSIRSMERLFEETAVKQIEKAEKSKKCVLHICAKDISITAAEVFCKVLMLYISRNGQNRDCYIMITECSQAHFVELARMMALFYNKQGLNPLMGRTQIFMSGDDEGEEFLITGINLGKAVAGTEKLAFARSVHPNCLRVLRKSLKNHNVTGEVVSPNDVISIVPFDMIPYPGTDRTLMERRLKKVLEQDVQSEKFGCKLENLHVRIGSKIHIRTFYEAELLFHNNYYTLRFAYWLYNELNLDIRLQKDKPFVLVGYENYSEMLINELCNMFESGRGKKPEYIIYEEGMAGKFRGGKELSKYKDAQFVVIVPINSTTTTHIKIAGFLEKSIRSSLGNRSEYRLNRERILNYGIVLIASTEQNMYWERGVDKNTIISAIDGKTLKYYIEVESEWSAPLRCRACFPENDYTQEQPLVETNKESVVPMHAISIRRPYPESWQETGTEKSSIETEELDRLKELSDILVYRHVERNGNHFNYYFETERLWENEGIKANVEEWLRIQGNNLFGKKEHKVYDIIVAPLHYSNTVFVEEVNNCLFSNAALVLHFDADREFRMNVMAKYSSIQQLYDNLHKSNEKAEINYHYIDDTIVSGRTYQRMKSLIGSLIRPEAESSVEINLFKSVVLLLNRMSKSSMKDYIDDLNYFMAYFNLGISSMRVNSDACILCKKYNEWNKLSEQASLNEVYTFWQNKSSNIVCTPVEKLDHSNGHSLGGPNYVEHPERAIQYMIASHRAKILLDEICAYENEDGIIRNIVEKLFPERVYPPDELIAMLKILCRPFMTFRREEKEAVFKLMLVMLEALLKAQIPEGDDKLNRLLRGIHSDRNIHVKIVQMLINCLAELESNAIIRKRNMERILAFAGEYRAGEEYEEFTSNYLNRIKQLTGQSKDYTKGLYLEYILLYGEEYGNIDGSNMNMPVLKRENREASFYRKLYLENTKLANYGIEYLADCFWGIKDYTQDNVKQILNGNYYFDNFIQYLAFHKVVNMDEKASVESFVSQAEFDKLVGMVRFELFYQRIFGRKKISGLEDTDPEDDVSGEKGAEEIRHNIQDKFVEMIEYLKAASGASDGEIIVPYKKDNEYTDGSLKYIALNMGKGSAIRALENDEQELLDFMRKDRKFEGDTYAICSHGGKGKWVLFKFYDKTGAGNNAMVIYMLFPFETEDMGELLHAVKNILIFRRKIWNIFNLSSDALLQSLSNNLFYKQQMLKSRSVGHMEFSDSLEQLEYVCEIVNNDAYTNKSAQDKELITKHFELVVNNLIGFMNAQLLGGKGAEYTDPCPPEICFELFWEKHDYVFKALERAWKLTIRLDYAHKGDCRIRPVETMDKMIPSQKVLLIMFLAIFQNIRKHCETDVQEIECGVYIEQATFADGERPCLCIKNRIPPEGKQYIEKMISPGAYRVTNGISLAVIFDICRSYYPETRYSDIFCVPEGEQEEKHHENSGKNLEFVVKLPILI